METINTEVSKYTYENNFV